MKKQKILIAILAVVLAAMLLFVFAMERGNADSKPGTETTTEPATAETTVPVSIPGVEDSIFDNVSSEPTSKPTEPTVGDTTPATTETSPATGQLTYESYEAMSEEEQIAFMESFESIDAFFEWYNAAKAEYEAQNPPIEIGDGVIDLDGLNGSND